MGAYLSFLGSLRSAKVALALTGKPFNWFSAWLS